MLAKTSTEAVVVVARGFIAVSSQGSSWDISTFGVYSTQIVTYNHYHEKEHQNSSTKLGFRTFVTFSDILLLKQLYKVWLKFFLEGDVPLYPPN